MKIFHKPHAGRRREAEFAAHLVQTLGGSHVQLDFALKSEDLGKPVLSRKVIASLQADQFMPAHRRERCIRLLDDLPEALIVALLPSRISFDIVVQQNEELYYWEFHEQQHLKLSVDRLQPVYDLQGAEYRVPRFLQRLVRDVWRASYFPDFTIVWHDWFARHRNDFVPELRKGFNEYHLESAFSFTRFCGA